MARCFFLFLFFCIGSLTICAQNSDSIKVLEKKDTVIATKPKVPVRQFDPKKAVRLSLMCPGLGQIYNRRYWKLPIVYAGLGVCTYFIASNQINYTDTRNQIRAIQADTLGDVSRLPYLRTVRDYYRKNRDLAIIFGVLAYSLTAVEAYVDAHLRPFSVSDDLTMSLRPSVVYTGGLYPMPGVGASLTFR